MWTKNVTCHSSIQQMLPTIKPSPIITALMMCSKGNRDGDEQDTGHSYDAHLRINFNESRLLHLPMHRKTVKSLTLNVGGGAVISINLLAFGQMSLFLFFVFGKKTSSFTASPQSYLRRCLLRHSPL